MPVPTSLDDLDPIPSNNSPDGAESVFPLLNDHIQAAYGFIAQVRDRADAGVSSADLAATDGAALVGYDGGAVQGILDGSKPMANYTALRDYTGRATGVRITRAGLAGIFQRDDADTTSADNGGTIIVDASGRRWKRLFAGPARVEWWGAAFDGSTDDTDAIQAAWNSGNKEIAHPPGVAICNNLTLPSASRVRLIGAGKEQTVIKAKSGITNTNYLAAQAAYINNSTNGSAPIIIDGMQFDGNGLVNSSVVIYSYFSEFVNSQAKGSLVAPLRITSEGIGGANCATTLVENKVLNSTIDGTGATYSLRVDDSGGKCTDMVILGNIINGAGALLDTMAGANVSNNHFYGGTSALNRISVGSIVAGNYFENPVTLDDFKDEVVSLANNKFLGRVTVSFGAGGETCVFDGNIWQGSADLLHNYFGPDKRVVVNGGGFETATPVVFSSGSSTGWVSFNRVWNHSSGAFWTGSRQASVSSIRQELPFAPVVSSNYGDASATLTWTQSATTNRWTSALTSDKAVTLSTTNAINGARFRIVRTGGGAFSLNVGTGPLKALAANQWCEVEYDGAAWVLTASGAL